ncbi:hypothetical protein CDIK_3020 [Cucumispora dikerogammari]|nr:hypothetical protein CDIK_3020 [Cucumispora dikerogammari]
MQKFELTFTTLSSIVIEELNVQRIDMLQPIFYVPDFNYVSRLIPKLFKPLKALRSCARGLEVDLLGYTKYTQTALFCVYLRSLPDSQVDSQITEVLNMFNESGINSLHISTPLHE